MRRTQLYLDEHLWSTLHMHAASEGTTISELVRQALRDRYQGNRAQRLAAMHAFVGSRTSTGDSTAEVRELRKGSRFERFKER